MLHCLFQASRLDMVVLFTFDAALKQLRISMHVCYVRFQDMRWTF